jgi:arsenate reductase
MKKKVLILCTGNSCRSQMAHGYLAKMAPDWEVYSAGVATHGLNPYMLKVMKEEGYTMTGHSSNLVTEYKEIDFDLMLTVCDHAKETCPWFPGNAVRVHHTFSDPADATGSEEEKLNVYRKVRDEIKAWLPTFEAKYMSQLRIS